MQVFRLDIVIVQRSGALYQRSARESASRPVGGKDHVSPDGFRIKFTVAVQDHAANNPVQRILMQPEIFHHRIPGQVDAGFTQRNGEQNPPAF